MDVRRVVATGVVVMAAMPMLMEGRGLQMTAADAPASDSKQFEVASVKRNTSGARSSMNTTQPGGRFLATNVTLSRLIQAAYLLDESQLVGGPGWIRTDRFDVTAKAAEEILPFAIAGQHTTANPSPAQRMLRALLADRFQLVVHTERREQPAYALTLARADGRLGASLTRSTADCEAQRKANTPPPVSNPLAAPLCGIRVGPGNELVGGAMMAELAPSLSRLVGRIVVDRTGLTGRYNVKLTWASDQDASAPSALAPGGQGQAIGTQPDGPSLSTALQEQLGLKLESTRTPIDALVIDRAEPAAPD